MRREYQVSEKEEGRHLRSLLDEILVNVPGKGIRRAIQRGQIVVNKSRVSSNHTLITGDQISIHIQTSSKGPTDIDIPVVQEDAHFAIINKPAGLVSGGGRGTSISDMLYHILKQSTAEDALLTPRAVHRLDKPTSGLLLIAKTKSALAHLSKQFETRTIQKTYAAIVNAHVESSGSIDIDLADKSAFTYYKPIKKISIQEGNYTLVELVPKTGRTHQLRKHMAYIGHPIIGDHKYGRNIPENNHGLMLCATKLIFKHPVSNQEVICEITTPRSFNWTND